MRGETTGCFSNPPSLTTTTDGAVAMAARNHTQHLVTVYGLASSEDRRIRYVGQTSLKLPARRRLWITNARKETRRAPVFCWVRSLQEDQLLIVAIECNAVRDARERCWIARYRALYPDLLNLSDGGGGTPGVEHGAETRAKRSASVRESWQGETNRVRWTPTNEQRAKWRANLPRGEDHHRPWLGRKHSEETKRKMSEAAKAWRAARRAKEDDGSV